MKKIFCIFNLIFIFIMASCASENLKDYLVTIHTSFGDMKIILYDETPLHKQNFIELAKSGKYDSTLFHRVIENFMIQGGDIHKKNQTQESEQDKIDAEIVSGLLHKKGELAAARQGDHVNPLKKSSSCQFYIVQGKVWTEEELTLDKKKLDQGISGMLQKPEYDSLLQVFLNLQNNQDFEKMSALAIQYKDEVEKVMNISVSKDFDPAKVEVYTTIGGTPHLDDEYTVFGKVLEGLDILEKIAVVEKDSADRPVDPIIMKMTVEKISKKKITKNYGYNYPKKGSK